MKLKRLCIVTRVSGRGRFGLSAALGDWEEWLGAMEQLSLNLFAILLAGIGTLFVQRRLYVRRRRRLHHEARERAGPPIGQSRREPKPATPGGPTSK